MTGQVEDLALRRKGMKQLARFFHVYVIQIDKGIIQNQKHFLLLEQGIRQRQTHTQHHKISLTRAEIGKLSGLSQPLQPNVQAGIDQIVVSAIRFQHGKILPKAVADRSHIGSGQIFFCLLQKGDGRIQDPHFFLLLFQLLLLLHEPFPNCGKLRNRFPAVY